MGELSTISMSDRPMFLDDSTQQLHVIVYYLRCDLSKYSHMICIT